MNPTIMAGAPDPSSLPFQDYGNIKLVTMCALLAAWPEYTALVEWTDKIPYFKQYLFLHPEVGYYARPKDKFFLSEAYSLALDGGFSIVLVEDLS